MYYGVGRYALPVANKGALSADNRMHSLSIGTNRGGLATILTEKRTKFGKFEQVAPPVIRL